MYDPWYPEDEEVYLDEEYDPEVEAFWSYPEADTLPPYFPQAPTSRYEPGSGGCFLPMFIAPLLVVVLGSLFAAWVQSVVSVPSAQAVRRAEGTVPTAPALEAPVASSSEPESKGKLASFFTPSVQYWRKDILRWARQWQIDPNLVATVVQIESCGNPKVVSRAGAIGLFQVMPFHFSTDDNPYDPDTNAARGLAYLRRALDAFGQDARLALAGYNGGIGGASRAEALWPAETVRYAYWGSGIYAEARQGKKNSARLQEWLNAGGANLCAQAETVIGK